jgi:hypothetical protein
MKKVGGRRDGEGAGREMELVYMISQRLIKQLNIFTSSWAQ